MSKRLYFMCKRKGLVPREVAEVGVYLPETSNVLEFINDGIPALLIEADPVCVEKLRQYFASYSNVSIFPYAVWDENRCIALYRANASTFIGELDASPALINDSYILDKADRFEVEARRFCEIDNGRIDLLSIDIEGAEWYVIKHLSSYPQVIALEGYSGEYQNPFLPQIEQWMRENGYVRWFIDNTDIVYIQRGVIDLTTGERCRNLLASALTLLKHRLKSIKRKIRKRILIRFESSADERHFCRNNYF
ncbi:MAG: FkbM family methyltransferase [Candidatus Loosdrechtia sp.]|uniref:FkbM family methyltransferase n=1 Tax=Candidatus Loosdrechtia sp. TaxID=3101272 RepID=UPI003A65557F|nr:MAG: FkbM family methyltransferase [Candidatus Jettenia sp. AMX2]